MTKSERRISLFSELSVSFSSTKTIRSARSAEASSRPRCSGTERESSRSRKFESLSLSSPVIRRFWRTKTAWLGSAGRSQNRSARRLEFGRRTQDCRDCFARDGGVQHNWIEVRAIRPLDRAGIAVDAHFSKLFVVAERLEDSENAICDRRSKSPAVPSSKDSCNRWPDSGTTRVMS